MCAAYFRGSTDRRRTKTDFSAKTRYERVKAAYLCCLFEAASSRPRSFKVKFCGNAELNKMVTEEESIDPMPKGHHTRRGQQIGLHDLG